MVESLGFLGVRTEAFDETVALYRDGLRMTPLRAEPGAAWFRAADGTQVHVYGPSNEAHDFFWQVRLDHQVEQLRNGREPDEFVDPESLDASTRRFARDAFRAVSDVQRSLKGELTFPR